MVQRHGKRRRRRTASLAIRAFRPLHRALQGHRGDRAYVPPPGVFVADGDVHDCLGRRRIVAGRRRAHAFCLLGSLEEDRGSSLNRAARQGDFISTVTRPACWSPTVMLAWVVPRRSCQTWTLYWLGGRLSKANCPSAPVIA